MSYDIRLAVKIEGYDGYADVAEPAYASPTYNIGEMLRAATGWDFNQHEYYRCAEIIDKVEHGIHELILNKKEYKQYELPNGLGSVTTAIEALGSLRDCIYETAEYIPIEFLYMRW